MRKFTVKVFKAILLLLKCKAAKRVSKTVKIESLEFSPPRTDAEIRKAYREGRIAEMTPHQAGM